MDEEAIERRPGICNRGWLLAVHDSVIFMVETGTVTLKEPEPVRPVAGLTHRKDASKTLDAIRVRCFRKLCREVVQFPNHLPNQ